MTKKILAVGGSENVIKPNNRDFHYLTLLQNYGQYDITNISIGGMSSDEIFYRIVPEVEKTHYDLVLVLWVPIGRKWVYFSDNNVDDFTIINKGEISWFNKTSPAVHQYAKLHYAYFDNQYINIHRYLSQFLLLQNYFKAKNIPLIMYHDSGDYINDILSAEYSEEQGFVNLSNYLKEILNFGQRPDHYVLEKLNVLKLLIDKIDRSVWIDFENFKFAKNMVDRQIDRVHAGPISHNNFFKILISELDNRKLL